MERLVSSCTTLPSPGSWLGKKTDSESVVPKIEREAIVSGIEWYDPNPGVVEVAVVQRDIIYGPVQTQNRFWVTGRAFLEQRIQHHAHDGRKAAKASDSRQAN